MKQEIKHLSLPANSDPKVQKTVGEFEIQINKCRDLFVRKMEDYGTSWRIMRPTSITDQIYIKARRIRSLEEKGGVGAVNEGIEPEFIGIVNYAAMGVVQLTLGSGEVLPYEEALRHYDNAILTATNLMFNKNHDYDEAWRLMRVSSFTDIILQKLLRTKEIEEHDGHTSVSEGIDANYLDMINYAIFALIKIDEQKK